MDYEKHLALSLWLGLGVVLILTLGMMPAPTTAADATLIVGSWEGTLDPGAQPKKQIVVHIAVAQDGALTEP
jgi:spermidine/putrescine-binding protein